MRDLATAGDVLAFADFVDGAINVSVHRLLVVGSCGLDGFMHLLESLDALAALVVARIFEIVLRLFEMLDGVLGMLRFLELHDGSVHFGLPGPTGSFAHGSGTGTGGAAKREGAKCGEEGFAVCFHDGVWV